MVHEVLSYDQPPEEQRNGRPGDGLSQAESEEAVFLQTLSSVHSIVLDWTPGSFIDSVGAKAIKQVLFGWATG